MFEKVAYSLIQSYLGKFIEFDENALNVSLWSPSGPVSCSLLF